MTLPAFGGRVPNLNGEGYRDAATLPFGNKSGCGASG
jgi:hypothetical protein